MTQKLYPRCRTCGVELSLGHYAHGADVECDPCLYRWPSGLFDSGKLAMPPESRLYKLRVYLLSIQYFADADFLSQWASVEGSKVVVRPNTRPSGFEISPYAVLRCAERIKEAARRFGFVVKKL